MMENKISMGIDASTTSTGWSIFKNKKLIDYGVIQPIGENWRNRLLCEKPELVSLIKKYKPDIIYIEDVPLKKNNPEALMILSVVQGFLYGLISQYDIPIVFLYPSQWRSRLNLYDGTKNGMTRKELKKKSILKANELFNINLVWKSPNSKYNQDDIADAILIAYSQIKEKRFSANK